MLFNDRNAWHFQNLNFELKFLPFQLFKIFDSKNLKVLVSEQTVTGYVARTASTPENVKLGLQTAQNLIKASSKYHQNCIKATLSKHKISSNIIRVSLILYSDSGHVLLRHRSVRPLHLLTRRHPGLLQFLKRNVPVSASIFRARLLSRARPVQFSAQGLQAGTLPTRRHGA